MTDNQICDELVILILILQGIKVGEFWKDRQDCRQWGAHFPHVAGIAGQSTKGSQSVVLSGGWVLASEAWTTKGGLSCALLKDSPAISLSPMGIGSRQLSDS
jgi:hypothetical protein